MSMVPRVLIVLLACTTVPCILPCKGWAADEVPLPIVAQNPAPDNLPTLGVYAAIPFPNTPTEFRVSATFPNVPDLTCDCWCYEDNESELRLVGILAIDGGRLELRHLDRKDPRILYLTTITPKPGAVEFLVRAQLAAGATGSLPNKLIEPHMCWQLKRAPGFCSKPDPYPEFVKRCFIFTDKGRTFLGRTVRKPIPSRPASSEQNNPPWVQLFAGTWQDIPAPKPDAWADYSPDRFVTTVIGAVSRDHKYLAALVSDSASVMCQAWHDCMHNSAAWEPENALPGERTLRMTIYAMQNDPAALMNRALEDYPKLRPAPVVTDAPVN